MLEADEKGRVRLSMKAIGDEAVHRSGALGADRGDLIGSSGGPTAPTRSPG